ncbi:PRTRC system protein E [Ornithobacterium rhinotracheale]
MEFFKRIENLGVQGALNLTIQSQNGEMVVSVILNDDNCGDKAKKIIPPLVLRGTAEELDNAFFESIAEPVQETSSLLQNMEQFLKAKELAKKQSAMEKEKAEKEKAEREKQKKAYEKILSKVEELEKEGKYREAWSKMPNTADYPMYEKEIANKKKELSAHFAPSLFD